jgi:hypothetical protein
MRWNKIKTAAKAFGLVFIFSWLAMFSIELTARLFGEGAGAAMFLSLAISTIISACYLIINWDDIK